MSWDVYLRPRNGDLDKQELITHLLQRKHYSGSEAQAFYENADTGVYFSFEPVNDEEFADYPILFNINFLRPSFFIQEAVEEVGHVVEKYDLLVAYSEEDPLVPQEFRREEFANTWMRTNQGSAAAILSDASEASDVNVAPRATLMRAWQWNYAIEGLQEELGETVFVPRILFLKTELGVSTAATWPDGIMIAVPEVDYFLVPREQLAPKRLLLRKADIAIANYEQARPLLEKYTTERYGARVLDYGLPPPDVQAFVTSLPKMPPGMEALAPDSVLDAEFLSDGG